MYSGPSKSEKSRDYRSSLSLSLVLTVLECVDDGTGQSERFWVLNLELVQQLGEKSLVDFWWGLLSKKAKFATDFVRTSVRMLRNMSDSVPLAMTLERSSVCSCGVVVRREGGGNLQAMNFIEAKKEGEMTALRSSPFRLNITDRTTPRP